MAGMPSPADPALEPVLPFERPLTKWRDGYTGDSHNSLRTREVFKYYHPPEGDGSQHTDVLVPQNEESSPDVRRPPEMDSSRIASHDPVLACITNLTARVLNCKRSMITMVGGAHSYIVAESTRSLSIASPHTSEPGDEIWLGSGTVVPAAGSLCENTVSLLPPANPYEQDMLFEINDLSQDPQYRDAGFVANWPYKRFYGATPLRTRNGVSIGTLCVFDDKPKPNGLTEDERITLSKLGDTVMNYLQVKQGDRDLKKGKLMEMGLSKFIAEGFHPVEGFEMTERREGRLWSEKILEQRRLEETVRKKKAEEKRVMIQERKFQEMVREREREWQREMEIVRQQYPAVEKWPTSTCNATATPTDPPREFEDKKRCQPAPLETLPTTSDLPESAPTVPVAAVATAPAPSEPSTSTVQAAPFEEEAGVSLMETIMNTAARQSSIPSPSLSLSAFHQDSLLTPPPSNFSGAEGYFDYGRSSSTQSSTDSSDGPRRRSEYEQTASFEPHFRAMFFRAATLIRNAIDANVVFLDGDLEGFFGAEEAECPAYSHVSTDKESEAATRAERPKACRRRSGILGYATAGGSSSGTTPSVHGTVESLGFDVSELNEEYLNRLVEENPTGRIVTHLQDFHDIGSEDDGQTDAILQRFLPGAKSVILVPLVDHNRKLFAVCVAWTSCATRSFCGDVEGSFVTAVTNTIIAETTRLNILNADKAKGEFISSISHELRSPLHGILASAEFLAESNLDAYQRSFVDTVISCGTTLLDTINHVLDFQKLSYLHDIKVCKSGIEDAQGDKINEIEQTKLQQVKQQRDVDLSDLVQDIVDGVCLGPGYRATGDREDPISGSVYQEGDKKLTVIVDIDHRDDGWIFCLNPAGLKRIINNITGNAMKYTESGWVRVRLRADEISGDEHGNRRAMVKISISDSGKGISRSFLKTKLFTPFSQENPLAPGAGLGMSIVRQIVGAMDPQSKIDVKSQVGKGTKVIVQIPMIYRPKPSANLDVDDIRSRVRGMRMRMIGFETSTNTAPKGETANLLRGSVVRYAKDYLGLEVLKDTATVEPDIIIANEITDDILQQIQSLGQKLPIILLCRHPPMDGGSSQLSGHISIFIRKPCGPRKFARAMAFCLGEMQKRSTDSGYETAPEEFDDSEPCADNLNLRVGLTRSTSASSHPDHDPATPATTAPSITSLDIDNFFGDELAAWRSDPDVNVTSTPDSEQLQLLPEKPPPPAPAVVDPPPPKPTVLAVEDNTINLMLLTTFLDKKGYNFDKAVDGLEALRKVKQKESGYDVILMDLQMPIMSGIESTREIRRHEEGQKKRSFIVALTGLAAVSDQKEAYVAGVDAFMVKPVNFKELERTLAEGLGLEAG